jgi:hypothetical protein
VVAGNGTPRLTGGLFFNTKYRNVDVGLTWSASTATRSSARSASRPTASTARSASARATSPGRRRPVAGQPDRPHQHERPNADRVASNNYSLSERWLESGDFTRIQNLVVGYTLPQAALTRLRLANARQPRST